MSNPSFFDYVARGWLVVKTWFSNKIVKFYAWVGKMEQKGKNMKDEGRKMLKEFQDRNI